ncbi:hypothetical protein Tco_0838801 [Tanacetum coccineum]|uniref:PB1-like domain-containing protein n=1 Tax=Tanacetum coccineum TaxID=301880 RepID=A0ABQ5AQN0_9ASTR
MVLVDHTGWKLRRKQWTGTTDQLIKDLEAAYDNASNMFSIRIHHGGKIQRYPGRMYVSGRVDIFDMVNIDLLTIIALNMIVLKLGYTEHGVTTLDSYLRVPRFRATLEEITDEPGSITANKTKKMLLLTWHKSSETTKELVCDSVTPSSLPQHDSSTSCKDFVCFADVAGSGVDSSGLNHDTSFGIDDLDLNLHEPVSTQEPIVEEVSTQEPIVAEVGTQEFSVEDVVIEDYIFVDEENEIVEPDVDVHLFGIGMDLPFNNIDEERKLQEEKELAELRKEMEGLINASVSRRCEGKVPVFTMTQCTGPTGLNRGMEAGPSGSSGPTTRSKKKNTGTNDDSQASPSFLDAHDKGDWKQISEKRMKNQAKNNKTEHRIEKHKKSQSQS